MGSKALQWVSGSLVVASAAVLIGYGAYEGGRELFGSDEVPVFVKVAVPVLTVGLLILLALVIGQRIQGKRHETFREVDF